MIISPRKQMIVPRRDQRGFILNPFRYGSGTPWTPANTTTQLWYDFGDAGSITTSSGAISQINDKSGNGRHLSQGTSASQPAYNATGLNGLGTATFDGSNDSLERSAVSTGLIQNAAAAMAFVLRKFDAVPSSNQYLLAVRSGAGNARLVIEGGRDAGMPDVGGRRLDTDGFQYVAGSAGITTGWELQCGVFDWASAQLHQFVNGAADGSSLSFQTTGNTSNTAPPAIIIGTPNSLGSVEFFDGDMAEAVLVHSIDTTLRQRIEGYMLWRRGLQSLLPVGHPYKSSPPTL